MCSIAGILGNNLPRQILRETLEKMGETVKHRGPDQQGLAVGKNYAFQHNRLSVIDPKNGLQPMRVSLNGFTYTLIYNGELYNTEDLRRELVREGAEFVTHCDTEVVLHAYIHWGEACSEKLNGIFAFALHDGEKNQVYFSRDRFGVKPFFYTVKNGCLIFSSEIKAILKHPDVQPKIDREGLWQLLFLLPVREAGKTVFKDIDELPPAHHAVWSEDGLKIKPYWKLEAAENRDSEDAIVENTRFLLTDAIQRQLVSDVPLCTLLSGGLDSSVITAVAAENYAMRGMELSTFSFEYEGNKEHFSQSLYQPQSDDEYALYLAGYLKTKHTVLTAETPDIVRLLADAANYRDFPGMADIDSSLLYYCKMISKTHKVAISGECSDEVFGGYPWFYRPEMLERDFFPWIHNPYIRAGLFLPETAKPEEGYAYSREVYKRAVDGCPVMDTDNPPMRQSRIASWLSINFFMSSLLERKDRMSMAASLEVRVPFADHRLVEYVYNVPWEIKFKNGMEKHLLRAAMKDYLPDHTLYRKKSPYPKTHNPLYAQIVTEALNERLKRTGSRLKLLLKKDALERINSMENVTWFGQLMGKPQLIAWLLQLDAWLIHYDVEFII